MTEINTSLGRILPGTDLKIYKPDAKGEGEICWRGRNVFMGYAKNQKGSQDTFDSEGYVIHEADEKSLKCVGHPLTA